MSFDLYINNQLRDQKVQQAQYISLLTNLSEPKIFKGITYTDAGGIQESSLISIVWERIKGLFGYVDHADLKTVKQYTQNFIMKGIVNNFLNGDEQDEKISQLAKRVGLIKENESFDKMSVLAKTVFIPEGWLGGGIVMPDASLSNTEEEKELIGDYEVISLRPGPAKLDVSSLNKEEKPLLPTSSNWSTAFKVGMVAAVILVAIGSYAYMTKSLPSAEGEYFDEALNSLCRKSVENYCKPGSADMGPLCFRDYLSPSWNPNVDMEKDGQFLCRVDLMPSNNSSSLLHKTCESLIFSWSSGEAKPNQFFLNYEPVSADLNNLPSPIMTEVASLRKYYHFPEKFYFKSHVGCLDN